MEKNQENSLVGRKEENSQDQKRNRESRRTREVIVKWNQMTALRFQTGGGGTSDIPGLPSGYWQAS